MSLSAVFLILAPAILFGLVAVIFSKLAKQKASVDLLLARPYNEGKAYRDFRLENLEARIYNIENPLDKAEQPVPSLYEVEESERELVKLTLDTPVALVKRPFTGVGIEARAPKEYPWNRIPAYGAQTAPEISVDTTLGTVLNRVVNAIGVDFIKPVQADFSTRQAQKVTNVFVVDSAGNVDTGAAQPSPFTLQDFDLGLDNSDEG